MSGIMENDTGEMIVKRVSVPIGLEELMEGLTKEVLLKKPDDIYLFAAEYFSKLLSLRDKGNYKVKSATSAQSVTKQSAKQPHEKLLVRGASKQLSRQISIRGDSPTKKNVPPRKAPTRKDQKDDKTKFIERRNKMKKASVAETKPIVTPRAPSENTEEKSSVTNKRERSVSTARRGRSVTKNVQSSPRQKSSTPRVSKNDPENTNKDKERSAGAESSSKISVKDKQSVPKISSVEETNEFIKDGRLTVSPPKVIKRPHTPKNQELITSLVVPQIVQQITSNDKSDTSMNLEQKQNIVVNVNENMEIKDTEKMKEDELVKATTDKIEEKPVTTDGKYTDINNLNGEMDKMPEDKTVKGIKQQDNPNIIGSFVNKRKTDTDDIKGDESVKTASSEPENTTEDTDNSNEKEDIAVEKNIDDIKDLPAAGGSESSKIDNLNADDNKMVDDNDNKDIISIDNGKKYSNATEASDNKTKIEADENTMERIIEDTENIKEDKFATVPTDETKENKGDIEQKSINEIGKDNENVKVDKFTTIPTDGSRKNGEQKPIDEIGKDTENVKVDKFATIPIDETKKNEEEQKVIDEISEDNENVKVDKFATIPADEIKKNQEEQKAIHETGKDDSNILNTVLKDETSKGEQDIENENQTSIKNKHSVQVTDALKAKEILNKNEKNDKGDKQDCIMESDISVNKELLLLASEKGKISQAESNKNLVEPEKNESSESEVAQKKEHVTERDAKNDIQLHKKLTEVVKDKLQDNEAKVVEKELVTKIDDKDGIKKEVQEKAGLNVNNTKELHQPEAGKEYINTIEDKIKKEKVSEPESNKKLAASNESEENNGSISPETNISESENAIEQTVVENEKEAQIKKDEMEIKIERENDKNDVKNSSGSEISEPNKKNTTRDESVETGKKEDQVREGEGMKIKIEKENDKRNGKNGTGGEINDFNKKTLEDVMKDESEEIEQTSDEKNISNFEEDKIKEDPSNELPQNLIKSEKENREGKSGDNQSETKKIVKGVSSADGIHNEDGLMQNEKGQIPLVSENTVSESQDIKDPSESNKSYDIAKVQTDNKKEESVDREILTKADMKSKIIKEKDISQESMSPKDGKLKSVDKSIEGDTDKAPELTLQKEDKAALSQNKNSEEVVKVKQEVNEETNTEKILTANKKEEDSKFANKKEQQHMEKSMEGGGGGLAKESSIRTIEKEGEAPSKNGAKINIDTEREIKGIEKNNTKNIDEDTPIQQILEKHLEENSDEVAGNFLSENVDNIKNNEIKETKGEKNTDEEKREVKKDNDKDDNKVKKTKENIGNVCEVGILGTHAKQELKEEENNKEKHVSETIQKQKEDSPHDLDNMTIPKLERSKKVDEDEDEKDVKRSQVNKDDKTHIEHESDKHTENNIVIMDDLNKHQREETETQLFEQNESAKVSEEPKFGTDENKKDNSTLSQTHTIINTLEEGDKPPPQTQEAGFIKNVINSILSIVKEKSVDNTVKTYLNDFIHKEKQNVFFEGFNKSVNENVPTTAKKIVSTPNKENLHDNRGDNAIKTDSKEDTIKEDKSGHQTRDTNSGLTEDILVNNFVKTQSTDFIEEKKISTDNSEASVTDHMPKTTEAEKEIKNFNGKHNAFNEGDKSDSSNLENYEVKKNVTKSNFDALSKEDISNFLDSEKRNVFVQDEDNSNVNMFLEEVNKNPISSGESEKLECKSETKSQLNNIKSDKNSKDLGHTKNAKLEKKFSSQTSIKLPGESFKQNNQKGERKIRRVKTVDVIKDEVKPEVKSRIPTADYRHRVKRDKENGKHSVLVKQMPESHETIRKLSVQGDEPTMHSTVEDNRSTASLPRNEDEVKKDTEEHKTNLGTESKKSSFEISKLHEEIKAVENESFKSSFNPYITKQQHTKQEINNASLNGDNITESVNTESNMLKMVAAALKIQSFWRGYIVRKNKLVHILPINTVVGTGEMNKNMEQTEKSNINDVEKNTILENYIVKSIGNQDDSLSSKKTDKIDDDRFIKAATKIQKIWRGFQVRNAIKQKSQQGNSDTPAGHQSDHQNNGQKYEAEEKFCFKKSSTSEKNTMQLEIEDKFIKAAVKIQKIWRGFNVRKNIKKGHDLENQNKIEIQRNTKLDKSESEDEIHKQSEHVKVEELKKVVKSDLTFENAAVTIQRIWRGFNLRKTIERDQNKKEKMKTDLSDSHILLSQVEKEKAKDDISKTTNVEKENKDKNAKGKDCSDTIANKNAITNLISTPVAENVEIHKEEAKNVIKGYKEEITKKNVKPLTSAAVLVANKETIDTNEENKIHTVDNKEDKNKVSQIKGASPKIAEDTELKFIIAAVMIQKLWRGFKVRRDSKQQKQINKLEEKINVLSEDQLHKNFKGTVKEDNDKFVKAATNIQKIWRGFNVRKNLKNDGLFGKKVETEHHVTETVETAEKIDTKDKKSALKIQSLWRGYQVRKSIGIIKNKLEDKTAANEKGKEITDGDILNAATKIQAGVRGYLQRKRYKRSTNKLNSITEEDETYNAKEPVIDGEVNQKKEKITSDTSLIQDVEKTIQRDCDSSRNSLSDDEILKALEGLNKLDIPSDFPLKQDNVKPTFYRSNTVQEQEIIKKHCPPLLKSRSLDNNNNNAEKINDVNLLENENEKTDDNMVKTNDAEKQITDSKNTHDEVLYLKNEQNEDKSELKNNTLTTNILSDTHKGLQDDQDVAEESHGSTTHTKKYLIKQSVKETSVSNLHNLSDNDMEKKDSDSTVSKESNLIAENDSKTESTITKNSTAKMDKSTSEERNYDSTDEKRSISVDSTDSAVTVIRGDDTKENDPNDTQSETENNTAENTNDLVNAEKIKETLLEHENLINDFQNKLLDQISGKNGEKTSINDVNTKFDIEQLRKELKEAGLIYNAEENNDLKHQNSKEEQDIHEQLLDYLNNFDSDIIRDHEHVFVENSSTNTSTRDLPDIKEEEVENKSQEDDKHSIHENQQNVSNKDIFEDNHEVKKNILDNKVNIEKIQSTLRDCENIAHEINMGFKNIDSDQKSTDGDQKMKATECENLSLHDNQSNQKDISSGNTFCQIPSDTKLSEKYINNKPLSEHVELINTEENDNIKEKTGCKLTDDLSSKEDDRIAQIEKVPSDLSKDEDLTQTTHGSSLLHTSEFHDTVVVPLLPQLPSVTENQKSNTPKDMNAELSSKDSTQTSEYTNSKLLHTGELHDTVVVTLPLTIRNESKQEKNVEELNNTSPSNLENIPRDLKDSTESPQVNKGLLHTGELHDTIVISIPRNNQPYKEEKGNSPLESSETVVHSEENLTELKQHNVSSKDVPSTTTGLLHTGELHDTVVVTVPTTSQNFVKSDDQDGGDKKKENNPRQVDGESQTTEANPVPIAVQLTQAPAGVEVLTSPRPVAGVHGAVIGVDDDDGEIAQAPDKDASPNETSSDFSAPSQPRSMESEKRKNATINNKSMEAEAATKIQAGFRGYQVRKQLKIKNGSSDINSQRRQSRRKSSGRITDTGRITQNKPKEQNDVEEKSAVKIQAGVRGFLVRRRQKKQNKNQES